MKRQVFYPYKDKKTTFTENYNKFENKNQFINFITFIEEDFIDNNDSYEDDSKFKKFNDKSLLEELEINDKDYGYAIVYDIYEENEQMDEDDFEITQEDIDWNNNELPKLLERMEKREKEFAGRIKYRTRIKELPVSIFITQEINGKSHMPIMKFATKKDLSEDKISVHMPEVTIDSDDPMIRGSIGSLKTEDLDYIRRFVSKNYRILLQYWVNHYDEEQVLQRLDFDV